MRRFILTLAELLANIEAFLEIQHDDSDLFVELLRRGRAFVYDPRTRSFANSKGIAFEGLTAARYQSWRRSVNTPGCPPFQGTPARLTVEAIVGREFRPDRMLAAEFASWCEALVPGSMDGVDPGKWVFLRLEDEATPTAQPPAAELAAPVADAWTNYARSWAAYAVWEAYNAVLYRIFAEWPRHDRLDYVVAKSGLLSRAYAAGLERHGAADGGGAIHDVATALVAHGPEVDELFNGARQLAATEGTLTLPLLRRLVEVHGRMVQIVGGALRDEHRTPSFVSKYCHFQLDWFPIYDSRARATLETWYPLYGGRNRHLSDVVGADRSYLAFCNRFFSLWTEAVADGLPVTVRRLDQYLLYCCDTKNWDG